MRPWKALLASFAIVSVTFVGLGIAGPAQAAGICYWYPGQFGKNSNCDGTAPYPSACTDNPDGGVMWADNKNFGDANHTMQLFLMYSRYCRAVWASGFTSPTVTAGSCYVKITRNSDGKTYYTSLVNQPYGVDGKLLYDADVTSYAYMYCSVGGKVYAARTRNW
jgi:hypothetical protein